MATNDQFVHLHVHDEYSPLDGAQRTPEMVKRVTELGQPAVAQTNHGYMLGSHIFYKECLKNGVKPIIGLEAYVAPGDAGVRKQIFWGTPEQRRADLSGSGSYTHLTLLAESALGVRNLYQLSGRSFTEGFYQKQRIDLGMLDRHSQGLIVLSGCLSGELLTRVALGQLEEAELYVQKMKEMLGDRFYIEVMDHDFVDQSRHTPALLQIAAGQKVPVVATNDAHYAGADTSDLHDALICVGTRSKLSDPNRMRFSGHGYYLKSRAEMDLLALPADALNNSLRISERIGSYEEIFRHERRMPELGIDDPAGELRRLTSEALQDLPDSYRLRVEEELRVILKERFADYFLVTADAIQFAKSRQIWVGPGRGSAAGSLVAYLLGITGLDPIEHGLFFERFLNEARISPPDIDTDFQASRRGEVFEYMIEKYGQDKVARIMTMGRIGAKKAIEDSVRIQDLPYLTGVNLKGLLPPPVAGREAPLSSIETEINQADQSEVDAYALAVRLEGFSRQPGMHAGGVVVSPVPLLDVLPTFIPKRNDLTIVTQYDMKSVEELGLVKLDFLSLAMGDVICDALRMSDSRLPTGLDDVPTFDLLRAGDTGAVFQLDSPGMRSLLRRMAPRHFGDIAAVVALYRPGPMGTNAHIQYADRLNGKEVVRYPHNELAGPLQDILGPTYGVIVYQEQIMSALRAVCGYTLGEADLVRKAMGKKDRELLASERPRFMAGGKANGYSEAALNALWSTMEPFADYSFPKPHAVGYALLAYWTAYLKAHHPKEYMAAVLTHEGDPLQAAHHIAEVVRLGIPVLPPSINGGTGWTPGKEGLHYGLTSIRGVGDKVGAQLISKAPYSSWTDFLRRSPKAGLNTGVVRSLIESGALDAFGGREGLSAVYETHVQQATQERDSIKKGDLGFGRRTFEVPLVAPDWRLRQQNELRLLGTKLSAESCILRATTELTEEAWNHLRRSALALRGRSALVVRYGPWELQTDLKVRRDELIRNTTGYFRPETV